MRSSGILLHISSLPSPCGIGTLGREAYNFVDFLKNSGQSFWQVLPVGTTSYGDSPYQSFSTFAGNPYFVDLDMLCEGGLLSPEDYNDLDFGDNPTSVDYGKIFMMRNKVLYKAYQKGFERDKEKVLAFCEQQLYWIEDYALYMALKEHFSYKSYREWDTDIRKRDAKAIASYKSKLLDKINFHKYVQYLFFTQWESLKTYANKNNVRI
ncbi:MAG TPA: 4-alpha-glucanotransferase, partial [Oscillospiraceae bacterium]|nr:4-alpha-glucanotransferase [Oscillospiraceae bacterium]